MKTFALVTFGCKVNQYESQALREAMERRGLVEVPVKRGADLIVLNTCAVTETAAAEARRLARRLHRRFPSAEITLTGCLAGAPGERLEGAQRIVPQEEKASLGDGGPSIFDLSISRFDGHARAFLKIQDGCDLPCSFCIVPKLRGASVSRPPGAALDEARRLIDAGHREIVLTGVHLGSYGKDLARRPMLTDLVERILALPGLGRVRLSSIEAEELTVDLLDLMAAEPRLCPHLHLPLQSGDDAILRAMRRRTNARRFLEACDRAASRVPDPALTTDVIVGFPGESEEQFNATLEVCRRAGFSRIHVFPYSPRRGTEAANLPDLPWRLKKERLHRVENLARGLADAFARRFVGRTVEILLEKGGAGYTERYLRASVAGSPATIITARVVRVEEGVLRAVPAPQTIGATP